MGTAKNHSVRNVVYGVLIASAITAALYGAFAMGAKQTENHLKYQPAEIAQSYYDVINQAIKMEPVGGPIHEAVRLASADNKITYDEYGPIVEKIENFIDSQMNADRDRGLLTAKAELFMTVKQTNNRLNSVAQQQPQQQMAYVQQPQVAPQYSQEVPELTSPPMQGQQPAAMAPQMLPAPAAQLQYSQQAVQGQIERQPQQVAQTHYRPVQQ